MSRRIGIYGGAFNPPTFAHKHVVDAVLNVNIVDEIWIVPSYVHFHGKEMVSYDIRIEMCKRTFYDIDRVEVKRIEGSIAELVPEYDGSTYSMLENLRKYQYEDYYLIIGQDNADSIYTWKNAGDLTHDEKFIIIPRQSDNDFIDVMGKPMWYNYHPHKYLDNVPQSNLSSTMARDLCNRSNGLHQLRNVVCEDVIQLIIRNDLYKKG